MKRTTRSSRITLPCSLLSSMASPSARRNAIAHCSKPSGAGEARSSTRHQNISAVLKGLGETWITGYKPAFNYQLALEKAVVRWLVDHPEWQQRIHQFEGGAGLAESHALWVGLPPTLSNAPPPAELEQALAVAASL